MNRHPMVVAASAVIASTLSACGGAVQSGVAIGKVGRDLGTHARTAPQGAEVCALQESLTALPGNEKTMTDVCGKAERSDLLWRRSMQVLGAYGSELETLAASGGGDNAGKLEAVMTGVGGTDSLPADGGAETAARDADVALVKQMSTGTAAGDLSRAIKDAGPQVKAICDGLIAYLDSTAKGFADLEQNAEKKRASHQDRRCGQVSGTNVCVGESPIDRMVYGEVFAQAALQGATTAETRNAVAGFCAAHQRAEQAAANGDLGKDKTYADVVAAVKGVQRAPAAPPPAKK